MERYFWNPTIGNGKIRVGDKLYPFSNSLVRTSDPQIIAELERRKDFYEVDKEAYETKIGIRKQGAAFVHKQADFAKPTVAPKVESPKVEKAPAPVKEEEPVKEESKAEAEEVAFFPPKEEQKSEQPKNKKKAK